MANYTKVPGLTRGKNIRIEVLRDKSVIPKFLKKIQKMDQSAVIAAEFFTGIVAEYIKDLISSSKKTEYNKQGRPTIEDTIRVEGAGAPGRGAMYGVVNAGEMDTKVPYWRLINNGGMIPEHFVPGGFDGSKAMPDQTGGIFEYRDHSSMGMQIKPGTIVAGMHFVERGQIFAKQNFSTIVQSMIQV